MLISVDGVVKNNGKTGCVGWLRDIVENWNEGFSRNIGFCSIGVVELRGILEGLKLAFKKGYKKVELQHR